MKKFITLAISLLLICSLCVMPAFAASIELSTTQKIDISVIETESARWIANVGGGTYELADSIGAVIEDSDTTGGKVISMNSSSDRDFTLMYYVPNGMDIGWDAENGILDLWLYVSDPNYNKSSGWTEIDIGSGGWLGNSSIYWDLRDDTFVEGWNHLKLDVKDAVVENGSINFSSIRWIRFCATTLPDDLTFKMGPMEFKGDFELTEHLHVTSSGVGSGSSGTGGASSSEPGKPVYDFLTDGYWGPDGGWMTDVGNGYKWVDESGATNVKVNTENYVEGSGSIMATGMGEDINLMYLMYSTVSTDATLKNGQLKLQIYTSDVSWLQKNYNFIELTSGGNSWIGEHTLRWQISSDQITTNGWTEVILDFDDAIRPGGSYNPEDLRMLVFIAKDVAEGVEIALDDIQLLEKGLEDEEPTEPEATEPEATEPEATEPEATEPEETEPAEPEYETTYSVNMDENWRSSWAEEVATRDENGEILTTNDVMIMKWDWWGGMNTGVDLETGVLKMDITAPNDTGWMNIKIGDGGWGQWDNDTHLFLEMGFSDLGESKTTDGYEFKLSEGVVKNGGEVDFSKISYILIITSDPNVAIDNVEFGKYEAAEPVVTAAEEVVDGAADVVVDEAAQEVVEQPVEEPVEEVIEEPVEEVVEVAE